MSEEAVLPATGFLDRVVERGAEAHRYQVYVPFEYTPEEMWPLVVYLHGKKHGGRDGLRQTVGGVADAIRRHPEWFPTIALFPQSPGDGEFIGETADVVMAALEQTELLLSIDADRVYLVGASMGGHGVYHMAMADPERFAALVVSASSPFLPPWRTAELGRALDEPSPMALKRLARHLAHIPFWIFHGETDDVVEASQARDVVAALQAEKADVRYTEYPDRGHDVAGEAFLEPELWPWLFEQRRPSP